MANINISSAFILAPDRIRVNVNPASVASLPLVISVAGFTVTYNATAQTIIRFERTGDYQFDLILASPMFAGGSPSIAYDHTTGTLADASGNTCSDLNTTALTDTLPSLQVLSNTLENSDVEFLRGRQNREAIWLTPGTSTYLCVGNSSLGPVAFHALVYGTQNKASVALTVQSSATSGLKDAFTNCNVRDEAGNAAASVTLPSGVRRRFTLESLSNPYIKLTANAAVLIFVRSRGAVRVLPGPGVL